MKVAIVTVFSSRNFGSYWQSRTLYDYLTSLGHDVYFLDTKARDVNTEIRKPFMKSIVRDAIKGKFEKSKFDFHVLKMYLGNLKEVRVIDAETVRKDFDYMVFGSDEIWNVSRENMRAYPVFWGEGYNNIKKVSYAPSINAATKEELEACGFKEALADFSSISVRDGYSQEVISQLYDGTVEKVMDPTFLFDESYYRQIPYEKIEGSYIAVYMFKITDEMYVKLRKIADLMGKKLVRVGAYDARFDQCVLAKNPFVYYLDADYVIANTFHGTAFAINFSRQLIVLNSNNMRKVTELIEQCGLGDRNLGDLEPEAIVEYVKSNPIDWNEKKAVVDSMREVSRAYLKNATK